jgi:hypothetical protein
MFLIHAEDDRLRKTVCRFQVISQVARNGLGACPQGNYPFKIFGMVFPVGDLLAVAIKLSLSGPPARSVQHS